MLRYLSHCSGSQPPRLERQHANELAGAAGGDAARNAIVHAVQERGKLVVRTQQHTRHRRARRDAEHVVTELEARSGGYDGAGEAGARVPAATDGSDALRGVGQQRGASVGPERRAQQQACRVRRVQALFRHRCAPAAALERRAPDPAQAARFAHPPCLIPTFTSVNATPGALVTSKSSRRRNISLS